MIDWSSHFDRIWSISYTGFEERRSWIESELKRTGILESGIFNWQRTVPTIFNDILFDVTKRKGFNECRSKGSLSCILGHYSCVKTSLGLGDRRILILEDDVSFLKDLSAVERGLTMIPADSDVVLFDWISSFSGNAALDARKLEAMKSDSVNALYSRFDHLWGGDCYLLSARAMKWIADEVERKFRPIDVYFTTLMDNVGFNRYFCIEQIAAQKKTVKSNCLEMYGRDAASRAYELDGLDLSKFSSGGDGKFLTGEITLTESGASHSPDSPNARRRCVAS